MGHAAAIAIAVIAFIVGTAGGNPIVGLFSAIIIGGMAWLAFAWKPSTDSQSQNTPRDNADHSTVQAAATPQQHQSIEDPEMSLPDQALLKTTEHMMASLAVLGIDVKTLARKLFEEAKAEAKQQYGDGICSESVGDNAVTNELFMSPRLAAGLTTDEVRGYWNRPLLLVFLEAKVQEYIDFIAMDVARQQGKDLIAVAHDRRKRYPRYGNPSSWDPSLPANKGFTVDDSNIYPEFLTRVGRWQEQTPESKQHALLENYTSFNAMIRALLREGKV